jgi:LysM repeat protein
MIPKSLTILVLVAAILGGSAYFIHELYYKDQKLDIQEVTAVPTPTPEPTPDPGIAAWAEIKDKVAAQTMESRDMLAVFLSTHPAAPTVPEARQALGRVNLALFKNPETSPGTTVYTVKKGDSLARIASQLKSNAELIFWANDLPNINLQIGQSLIVPSPDTAVIINRSKSLVTLMNQGTFFKDYTPVSMQLPASVSSGEVDAKVADRIALKGDTRVAFGHKDYPATERSILVNPGPVAIRTPPAPAEDGTTPPMPAGIVLSPEDFAELYVLVKSGTPVLIK